MHGGDDGGGEPGTVDVVLDGSGTGSVVSDPVGIVCPGLCSAEFADGTEVTLSAAKASGSTTTALLTVDGDVASRERGDGDALVFGLVFVSRGGVTDHARGGQADHAFVAGAVAVFRDHRVGGAGRPS